MSREANKSQDLLSAGWRLRIADDVVPDAGSLETRKSRYFSSILKGGKKLMSQLESSHVGGVPPIRGRISPFILFRMIP